MRRLVLGIAVAVTSLMPSYGVANDQEIADFIKQKLQLEQQQGRLKGFNVDMQVQEGTVSFTGHVSNPQQEMMILRTAQLAGPLGVKQVVDNIDVKSKTVTTPIMSQPATAELGEMSQVEMTRKYMESQASEAEMPTASPLRPVAYQQPANDAVSTAQQQWMKQVQAQMAQDRQVPPTPAPAQAQAQAQAQAPVARTAQMHGEVMPGEYVGEYGGGYSGEIIGNEPMPFATCGTPPMGAPMGAPMAGPMGAPMGAPMGLQPPVSMSAPAGPAMSGSPNLPGYAWPGYAAHPNFGAVSYPKQHSASAWPYIGPFYPYPQVPLGWRKVTLEWDDGWWQLDFKDK